jgi:hypothetical protein
LSKNISHDAGNVRITQQCILCAFLSYNVTAINIKTWSVAQKMLLCRIYVVGSNKAYSDLHVKRPIFLPDFNEIWTFLGRFSYNSPISNFTAIRPVGAALMYAGTRTGRTKLEGAFHNYTNAPNNSGGSQ